MKEDIVGSSNLEYTSIKEYTHMDDKFDGTKYKNEWKKSRYKLVGASYKIEYVEEFRDACIKLGIKQSQVFKDAMDKVIEEAQKKEVE